MNAYESLLGVMGMAFAFIAAMFIVVFFAQSLASRKRRH